MFFVMLARMTAEDPIEGYFRSYAKKAYGRWAGFSSGWVYWSAELLIMGSQLTALSLFSRFWLPQLPMWIFATVYGVLGLGIIIVGTKGFERLENIFAVKSGRVRHFPERPAACCRPVRLGCGLRLFSLSMPMGELK